MLHVSVANKYAAKQVSVADTSAMLQVSIADIYAILQFSVAFPITRSATKPLTGNHFSVSCILRG